MSATAGSVQIRAYAKLNLTLEVLHRRADRYHELRSVVQTISLADELELTPNTHGTKLRLSGYAVPQGDDNLVMTAVRQMAARLNVSRDLELRLDKRIPPGRGLGGGSSDAAAVLAALAHLYGTQLREEDLAGLAAETGSDVPLFRRGGTLLMSGRGERLVALPAARRDWQAALAWPDLSLPTEIAYGLLTEADFGEGEHSRRLWEHLQAGGRPEPELLHNCFSRAVYEQWPPVAQLHAQMERLAGVLPCLTGTGSALFVLTDQAPQVAEALREQGYEAVAVQPTDRGHELTFRSPGEEA